MTKIPITKLSDRFCCPVAVHLILIKQDQILLLRRYQTGYADGMYSVPAGCLEGNETVTHAMIREAFEETGIVVKPEWLKVTAILHRKHEEASWESIAFFLTASHYEGLIENREPHKCSELRFFPLGGLPNDIIPYVQKGIDNSLKGIIFDEFGW